jgi:pimeloyl-ACP methyl ester carboxylesterase
MPKIITPRLGINYEILGSGEPLLLIIGLSFSLADWGDVFPKLLAQNYQVILFDNRDAGLSDQASLSYTITDMADDTAALLDALNISQCHVLGVSMGGMIAQALALRYPQRVKKLMLGCTMAGGTCSQLGDQQELAEALLTGDFASLLFPKAFIKTHQAEIDALFAKANPLHSQGEALQRQMQAFLSFDACVEVKNIQAETLVLTGDDDLLIPAANSYFIQREIPGASLQMIHGAGHGFSFSHDAETAQYIRDFLK